MFFSSTYEIIANNRRLLVLGARSPLIDLRPADFGALVGACLTENCKFWTLH
jgi:hypothetical protein